MYRYTQVDYNMGSKVGTILSVINRFYCNWLIISIRDIGKYSSNCVINCFRKAHTVLINRCTYIIQYRLSIDMSIQSHAL